MSQSRVRSRNEVGVSARWWRCVASLFLVALMLAACAGPGTPATPTAPAPATETPAPPEPSAEPTATATKAPPAPPATRAPLLTATPRPTRSATSTRQPTAVPTGPTEPPIVMSSTSELTPLGLGGDPYPNLAVGGAEGNVLYAGRVGVMRSLDGGKTWDVIRDEEQAPKVTALAVAPSNPNVVYVGVNDGCSKTKKQPGYLSTDGGDTWKPIGERIQTLTIDPKNAQTVYIVDCEGLKRSIDSGLTWETLTAPKVANGAKALVAVAPSNTDHLYVAVFGGATTMTIAHSIDRGVTWKGVTPKIVPNLDAGVVLQSKDNYIAAGVPQALLVVANNPEVVLVSTSFGVFRTEDAGATWTRLDGGLENTAPKGVLPTEQDGSRLNTALVTDPDRPGLFWVGTGASKAKGLGLFRSRNSGENWRKAAAGLEGKYIYALALGGTPRERLLYVATDDGIWVLTEP